MDLKRNLLIGGTLVGLFAVLAVAQSCAQQAADTAAETAVNTGDMVEVPLFEVDPLWPKPLPNHWLLGSAIGVYVDEQDHVWMIHRSSSTLDANERGLETDPPTGECCAGAPPVLEFDQDGTLLRHWGGPGEGYEWPTSNHGLGMDATGNIWIGGNGPGDSQVLKFTRDGMFLAQYGHANARRGPDNENGNPTYVGGSLDKENFGRVAKVFIDDDAGEAYIADGYLNKRVAVLDSETGEMKRFWGAYGNEPDDTDLGPYDPTAPPAQQFRNPVHCADLSNDGLVYVCDRANDRIQVFQPDGTFVKEQFIARESLGEGSVWDIAFSPDAEQTYIYLADGRNMKVHILLRDTLEELTSFGDGGRQPGQFFGVHSIATDSQGNIYTTETYEGKRIQKFVYKGMGLAPRSQGVVWPAGTAN